VPPRCLPASLPACLLPCAQRQLTPLLCSHEITDNWVPPSDGSTVQYDSDIAGAWSNYLGNGNPVPPDPNIKHFNMSWGQTSLFFLDTRGHRTPGKIVDDIQLQDLFSWLLWTNATGVVFKFILSPVGVTASFYGEITDSWGAYTAQRNQVLDFITQNNMSGVVFLSGDSHFAYSVELGGVGSGVFEFSASPISAFDYTLGGFAPYPADPWAPLAARVDAVRWDTIARKGQVALTGFVDVDTESPEPTITVTFYDGVVLVHTETLNLAQMGG
jgi:hypothetical protein